MKTILINLLLLSALFSCSTPKLKNKDLCFLLYDLKKDSIVSSYGDERCDERLPTASTFKIPLAVIAYDSHIISRDNSLIKWDGEERMIDAWNKDQTAESWMRHSAVWYSQVLTPQIGKIKIEYYLKNFDFGNADMSGGIKYAWLTPAPFKKEEMRNSLKISGREQVEFLKKLWKGELKASKTSQELTRSLLPIDPTSPNTLMGKTGSGFVGKDHNLRLGWYVGFYQTKKSDYVVVINFTDKQKTDERGFGGAEARELAKNFIAKKDF